MVLPNLSLLESWIFLLLLEMQRVGTKGSHITQPFILYSKMGKRDVSFSDKAQKLLRITPTLLSSFVEALPSLKERKQLCI